MRMHLLFGKGLATPGYEGLVGVNDVKEHTDSKATKDGLVLYSNNDPLKIRTILTAAIYVLALLRTVPYHSAT